MKMILASRIAEYLDIPLKANTFSHLLELPSDIAKALRVNPVLLEHMRISERAYARLLTNLAAETHCPGMTVDATIYAAENAQYVIDLIRGQRCRT
jgi:hypothetical protein